MSFSFFFLIAIAKRSYPPFHGDNNYAVFENVLNGVLNIPTTVDPLAAVCFILMTTTVFLLWC